MRSGSLPLHDTARLRRLRGVVDEHRSMSILAVFVGVPGGRSSDDDHAEKCQEICDNLAVCSGGENALLRVSRKVRPYVQRSMSHKQRVAIVLRCHRRMWNTRLDIRGAASDVACHLTARRDSGRHPARLTQAFVSQRPVTNDLSDKSFSRSDAIVFRNHNHSFDTGGTLSH